MPSRTVSAARLPFVVSVLLASVSEVAADVGTDRAVTLQAIHQLENPRNVTRAGPRGELGAYQFRAGTWSMHTSEPFSRALDRAVSDHVAIRHYDWLKRGLEAARMAATPYTIALAWNGGLTAAITGRAPASARDYASRAANLARVLRAEAVVASSPVATN